jgi:hypothetical protein
VGSSMVNPNIELIKGFFQKEMPLFTVVSENSYSMFWDILLTNKEIEIKITGDVGGFSISVFIEKTEFPLWQYDRKVNDLGKTNAENILSQLVILQRFINELKLDSSN